MVAIAMTREMGTLGKDVAAGLAASLDLKIIHSELIEHDLAKRLRMQDSAVHHYLEGSATLLERWKIDRNELSQYTAEEILEIAQAGNVIVRGWGSVSVLRSVPHVLRVRICAPSDFREKVIMERLGLKSASEARREIEKNDAIHHRLMRGFFGVSWEDPQLYHIVLNTSCVPVDTCVRAIRLLTDDPVFAESEKSRAVLADRLIEARVRAALKSVASNVALGGAVDIAVTGGLVVLSGIVAQGGAIADLVTRIRQIDGVKDVNNRVRLVSTIYGV